MAIGLGLGLLISAIAGLAGAGINAGISASNNAKNLEMQKQTNETQIELANTAHQREMADLKAAGLNPVLTANGGSGSAVPSLSAPQSNMNGVMASVSNAASSISTLMLVQAILGQGGSGSALNQKDVSKILKSLRM